MDFRQKILARSSCAFFIAEKRLRHPTKVGKVLDISKDLTYVSRD